MINHISSEDASSEAHVQAAVMRLTPPCGHKMAA